MITDPKRKRKCVREREREREKARDSLPGVYAGVVGLAAADAPGHDPDLGPVVPGAGLHGAAGISLNNRTII